MKKLLKVLAVILCLVMAVSVLGACQSDNPNPSPSDSTEKSLTDGMFLFQFDNDGRTHSFYVHFYDNGMFYYSMVSGNIKQIGYYTVVDGEQTIQYNATREDCYNEVWTTTTVNKTVKYTDIDGNELGVSYWAPELGMLYLISIPNGMNFASTQAFEQQASDWTPDSSVGTEMGVALFMYEDSTDTSCYVEINHNGTFVDMMGDLIEGTWTKDGNTYTLKDPDSSDTAKLTVNGDNATYVGYDGTTVEVSLHKEESQGGSSSGGTQATGYSWTCADAGQVATDFSIVMKSSDVCEWSFTYMKGWTYTCNVELDRDNMILTILDWTACDGQDRDDSSSAAQVWGMCSYWNKWQLNDDGSMNLITE